MDTIVYNYGHIIGTITIRNNGFFICEADHIGIEPFLSKSATTTADYIYGKFINSKTEKLQFMLNYNINSSKKRKNKVVHLLNQKTKNDLTKLNITKWLLLLLMK